MNARLKELIKNKKYLFEIQEELDNLDKQQKLDIKQVLDLMFHYSWTVGERIHTVRKYKHLVNKQQRKCQMIK